LREFRGFCIDAIRAGTSRDHPGYIAQVSAYPFLIRANAMKRIVTAAVATALALVLAAPAGAADEKKKKKQAPDFSALFTKLDTNGDKKLSKEEFVKFVGLGEKKPGKEGKEPKGYATARDDWFKKLDTNNDGFLSATEFAKVKEVMAANPAKKKKTK
jgi:EF-hand domain pair